MGKIHYISLMKALTWKYFKMPLGWDLYFNINFKGSGMTSPPSTSRKAMLQFKNRVTLPSVEKTMGQINYGINAWLDWSCTLVTPCCCKPHGTMGGSSPRIACLLSLALVLVKV